jgi:hypothetical protein
MKITKLSWTSEASKEAELIVEDGLYKCLVFSCPCTYVEGEKR